MKYALMTPSTLDRAVKAYEPIIMTSFEGYAMFSPNHKFMGTVINGKLVKPLSNRIKNTIMVDGKRMVCRIYDTGPDNGLDRYTVAFKGYRIEKGYCVSGWNMVYPYIGCSALPFHPQGIGFHDDSKVFMTGKHLGKRIRFENCPDDVKKFILQSI